MTHLVVWVTAALFLGMPVGAGLAEQDAGIPPMLETQRPLAQPPSPAKPPPPPEQQAQPVSPSSKKTQAKKVRGKKAKNPRAALAGQKKSQKPAKKKGVTAKPRSKSADHRS
jgi:hypothetical protein